MKNIFKSFIFSCCLVTQMFSVLMINDPSAKAMPVVAATNIVEPKIVQPKIIEPKIVQPMVVQPTVVQPKIVEPKIIQPKIIQATVVQPSVVQPTVIQSTAVQPVIAPVTIAQPVIAQSAIAQPVAKVINPTTSNQIIGTVAIKNTSKFPAVLTGFKVKYKDVKGLIHHKIHKLKMSHTIPVFSKATGGVTTQIFTVSVNVPINSFVEGISDLLIQEVPVSVEYKGSAWMPGTTDKLYITSANGSGWMLDMAAMNKSYKRINSGFLDTSDLKKKSDDEVSKITNTTKSAVTQVVLKDSTNKKKFKNIVVTPKVSKSAQAPKKALQSTMVK